MQHHDRTARVVRRQAYQAMPWRNGGGVTFEIAREPREGVQFDWRLSLASIERSGPFSNFEGYQRAITLVSGAGCILHGIHAAPITLSTSGASALFPGAALVECELIAGSCCDLNLMVRAPGEIVSARHAELAGNEPMSLLAGFENAVFCLDGPVECVSAGSGQRIVLAAHDTFLVDADVAAQWAVQAAAGGRVLAHAWFTHR